jgi:hypothetical protein
MEQLRDFLETKASRDYRIKLAHPTSPYDTLIINFSETYHPSVPLDWPTPPVEEEITARLQDNGGTSMGVVFFYKNGKVIMFPGLSIRAEILSDVRGKEDADSLKLEAILANC